MWQLFSAVNYTIIEKGRNIVIIVRNIKLLTPLIPHRLYFSAQIMRMCRFTTVDRLPPDRSGSNKSVQTVSYFVLCVDTKSGQIDKH